MCSFTKLSVEHVHAALIMKSLNQSKAPLHWCLFCRLCSGSIHSCYLFWRQQLYLCFLPRWFDVMLSSPQQAFPGLTAARKDSVINSGFKLMRSMVGVTRYTLLVQTFVGKGFCVFAFFSYFRETKSLLKK